MSVSIEREGGVAVVTVDNPPVNAVSAEVRQGLQDAAETLDADDAVAAVVLLCAGRTFIAGADVNEFGKPPVPPHLPDVIARIEAAQKPWVAAVHGSALGGGFEIAMGCRYRLIAEGASVGLPEVTLGLVPGAGGTVRTPRLAGVEAAVELVTSGRPVKATQAKEMGLVDEVVAGDLREAAVAFAQGLDREDLPAPVAARSLGTMSEERWISEAKKLGRDGNPGPLRALQLIRNATEVSFEAAMRAERGAFLELRGSDEAAALRRLFFAERAATRPVALKGVEPRRVDRVGVVGGGTMGAGIAAALRQAGFPVVLVERDEAAVGRARDNVERVFAGGVKRGKLTEAAAAELADGVLATTEYPALAVCEPVIEAVFEDIDVKRPVFERLVEVCRPDAVLATNTSYLDPREIVGGLPSPERFVGLHFFSPANVMKLLEIVPLPETSPEVLATAFALAERLRKVPVKAGICEGFIGNRILKRYRAAAEELVRVGVAIAEIDGAMRDFGFRMGPFEAQDLGGLDIAFLQREGARKAGQDVPETLGDVLVRAGRKGQKTSAGWYDYEKGDRTPLSSNEVEGLLGERIRGGTTISRDGIADRLVAAMADEGERILAEGVADAPVDIDLVEVHGYGFPRWKGGPMHYSRRRR